MAAVSPSAGTSDPGPEVPLVSSAPATATPKKAADYMLIFYWDKDGTEGPNADKKMNGDEVIERIFVHKDLAQTNFPKTWAACKGKRDVPLKDVREACLQDFKAWLPHLGFTIQCFKSIDEDELFMRISLDEFEVQKFYAEKTKVHLQLSRECVEQMDIRYPDASKPELCSPPFMPYEDSFDEAKVKELNCKKSSIFKNHWRLRNPEGSILRSVDSIRIIRRTMNRLIDVEDLNEMDIIRAKYPIHVKQPLDDLRAEWATFEWNKLFNIWAPLPLNRIRNYFGESVAFYFAWVAHTVRSLAVLAIFGIACKVYLLTDPLGHDGTEFYGQLAFGVLMAGWGTAYTITWKREEYHMCVDWNMLDISDRAALRPDFVGEMKPSPVNTNDNTKQYDPTKKKIYQALSSVVTFIFLCLAFGVILGTRGLEPELQPYLGPRAATAISVLIAVEIQIFGLIWNTVARKLVVLENPRTDFEYLDLLIWKLAPFTLFTTYNTFMWIAVAQKYMHRRFGTRQCGTPDGDGDCVAFLQTSLITTFASQGAMIVVGMAVPYIMLWRELKNEAAEVAKKCKEKGIDKVPERSFMEKQAKMGIYDTDAEINDYMTSVTVIGYVLLFGAAAPSVAAIALVVLLFQLRANAYKLTKLTRRPYPTLKRGIGSWGQIVDSLTWTGLFFYVGIPIMNAHLIEHWDVEWQAVLCFGAEHVIVAAKLIILQLVGTERPESNLLLARRRYVTDKLLIGKDDPDTLDTKYKKEPLEITKEKCKCLNATEAPDEWPSLDRMPELSFSCKAGAMLKPENELFPDRDIYV
jgi:hypothetical protein